MNKRRFIKMVLKVLCVLPFIKTLTAVAIAKPIPLNINGMKGYPVFPKCEPKNKGWLLLNVREGLRLSDSNGKIWRCVDRRWIDEGDFVNNYSWRVIDDKLKWVKWEDMKLPLEEIKRKYMPSRVLIDKTAIFHESSDYGYYGL